MHKVWSLKLKFCNLDLEDTVEVKPAICSLFFFDTSFKREQKTKVKKFTEELQKKIMFKMQLKFLKKEMKGGIENLQCQIKK